MTLRSSVPPIHRGFDFKVIGGHDPLTSLVTLGIMMLKWKEKKSP
jgi:hypothetical protein